MKADHQVDWTEKRVAQLRSLWSNGSSYSAIAHEMELSKGQVAGKAYRLGLSRSETIAPSQVGRVSQRAA